MNHSALLLVSLVLSGIRTCSWPASW